MQAGTNGDELQITIINAYTNLPQNLTGYIIKCEVMPPVNIGGQPYAWPGQLIVQSPSTGLINLITTPTCFPVGSSAPYYLEFSGGNNAGTLWKSRLFPIQIAVSIL